MLVKDPEERMELIDFITTDYATMNSEEFEQFYLKTKGDFEEQKQQREQEEEIKKQEEMLAKLDLDNDKLGSGYKNYRKISGNTNDPQTKNKFGGSSPSRGGKSTNEKKKKVKKEKQ